MFDWLRAQLGRCFASTRTQPGATKIAGAADNLLTADDPFQNFEMFDYLVRYAVGLTPTTLARREDLDFLVETIWLGTRDDAAFKPIDIRRRGTLLTLPERQALGLKCRVVSREFLSCLTTEAQREPEESAWAIYRAAMTALTARRRVNQFRRDFGEKCFVRLLPGDRACAQAASSSEQVEYACTMPDLPLPGCSRADQCLCLVTIDVEALLD